MAKVISTLFISADGVAEIDPDWHFPYFDENMGRAVAGDLVWPEQWPPGQETRLTLRRGGSVAGR